MDKNNYKAGDRVYVTCSPNGKYNGVGVWANQACILYPLNRQSEYEASGRHDNESDFIIDPVNYYEPVQISTDNITGYAPDPEYTKGDWVVCVCRNLGKSAGAGWKEGKIFKVDHWTQSGVGLRYGYFPDGDNGVYGEYLRKAAKYEIPKEEEDKQMTEVEFECGGMLKPTTLLFDEIEPPSRNPIPGWKTHTLISNSSELDKMMHDSHERQKRTIQQSTLMGYAVGALSESIKKVNDAFCHLPENSIIRPSFIGKKPKKFKSKIIKTTILR